MNSWEQSRRDELREELGRHGRLGLVLVATLAIFAAGFFAGIRYATPAGRDEDATKLALNKNADSLRVVRASADSIKHVDSSATAAVLARRPTLARLNQALQISPKVGDSTVVIERPAALTDGDSLLPTVRDTVPLPALVVSFIQEAKAQLVADSIALDVKDARILLLSRQVNLLEQRDSLHVEREQELQTQRNGAFRHGVVVGVKWTLGTAAAIAGVIKIVKLMPK